MPAELTLAQSGFRFWKDLNGDGLVQPSELGLVGPGNAPDVDFVVERNGVGGLRFRPVRAGTRRRVLRQRARSAT